MYSTLVDINNINNNNNNALNIDKTTNATAF